ncbi:MAG TPA: serine/threonine protein kinase [Polyangiaceae bacterium]|nr:serine/threonine protein kinase [Polyangiaceae bacterium]
MNDEQAEVFDDERTWEDLLGGALAPGDVLSEKYRVDELIGYGAMGFVLKAWHLQLDEPVAVKFLLPELAASEEALVRFEREARATFKIKSEHVVRVLDVGRLEEGHPFMVMEYLEGEELADQIYEGEMPIGKITDIVLQACAAIAEAHAYGIIHRDVKPDNLFLTRRRDGSTCVKVLDFGLSKFLPRPSQTDDKRQRAVTAEAQVMGTAHYMSPEQWVSAKDVSTAADIWSLGVILYEGLTGESPFMRNNLAAMCNAVLREDPPPILELRPDVPEALVAIVERCLAKEATDRFASVAELGEALRPYASTPSLLPTFPAPASDPPRGSAPTMTEVMSQPAIVAPGTNAGGEAAALPRLGLRQGGGLIETWADLLAEDPPRESGRMFVVLGVVAAVIVVGLVVALIF